jgi:hypothetical protein
LLPAAVGRAKSGADDRVAIEVIDCGQDSILELLFGDDTDVTQHGAVHLREEAPRRD